MALNKAALGTRALRFIGDSTVIGSFENDTSVQAKACRDFLDDAIIETLRARNWSFARAKADLVLDATNDTGDALEQWIYRYRLPADCLNPIQLVTGLRRPPIEYTWPYEVLPSSVDAEWAALTTYQANEYAAVTTLGVATWYRALRETLGDAPAASALDWVAIDGVPPLQLHTDMPNARLEYTRVITDVRYFPADFDNAVAARLAYYIEPRVTKGAGTLGDKAAQTWAFLIAQAEAVDANLRQRDVDPPSSFELSRTYGGMDLS